MELVGSLGIDLYVFWLMQTISTYLCSPAYPLLTQLPPCLQ